MYAKNRVTQVGAELENFLIHNRDDISPNIFVALENLGDILESIEDDFNVEIAELEAEIAELE